MKKSLVILFFVMGYLSNSLAASQTVKQDQSSAQTILLTNGATRCANVSALVQRLSTGETVDAYQANHLLAPASMLKLFTTATALSIYGPQYRIPTILSYTGTIQNGVLQGDLYIQGFGDPTLGSPDFGGTAFLAQWSKAVRQAGIRRITGRIIADVSYYDGDAINPGWLWEDIGNYYAPGIFALSYLDNTMLIQLRSAALGSIAQVVKTIPDIPGLTFENHILCSATDRDGAFVHGVPYTSCRYLTGTIPANQGLFGIKGDLPNPALLLAQHVTERLKADGITVQAAPQVVTEPTTVSRTTLYTHYSKPLQDIITRTNHRSVNLYAEMLFRNLAAEQHTPCTIHNSVSVMQQYWFNRGVNLYSARLLDGCGLAPQNGLSAEHFVHLLTFMAGSAYASDFQSSLPISGQSGTLRSLLAKTALDGKVHAKSGTIKGTRNYAGYIDLPDGDKLVFAVMVNNSTADSHAIQHAIEQYLLDVYSRNR